MLKYLFVCEYKDGTRYEQSMEDQSVFHKDKSAFADIDHDKLDVFTLNGAGREICVDLRTGGFIIDGMPFRFHTDTDSPLKDIKLIFARRHYETMRISGGERVKAEHLGSEPIIYRIGFTALNPRGEVVERVMEFL